MNPTAAPRSTVITTPAAPAEPRCSGVVSNPTVAASSPINEPTEMSISPVRMTNVSPQPTITPGTHCTSMSRTFVAERNTGLMAVTTATVNASKASRPY